MDTYLLIHGNLCRNNLLLANPFARSKEKSLNIFLPKVNKRDLLTPAVQKAIKPVKSINKKISHELSIVLDIDLPAKLRKARPMLRNKSTQYRVPPAINNLRKNSRGRRSHNLPIIVKQKSPMSIRAIVSSRKANF